MSNRKIICARSVHIGWTAPENCHSFAVTLDILKSAPGTFFMAVGWSQGYFGIQDLGDGQSGLICSVWDGNDKDPNIVQQAKALSCAPGATVRRFGGEGVGLQCLMPFPLPTKSEGPYRFCVDSEIVTAEWTLYRAFVHFGTGSRIKLVEYLSRMEGRRLRGFYSFIEDFRRDGDSAEKERRALFSSPVSRIRFDTPIQYGRFAIAAPDFEGDNYDARVPYAGAVELATGGTVEPSIKPHTELCLTSIPSKH